MDTKKFRIIEELQEIVGRENVLFSPEELLCYSYDAVPMIEEQPQAVVFPLNTDQVVALVRFAAMENLPLVPRGSGTNLSGGAIPTLNSIVLCFSKMNKILEIDQENLTSTVEPGVITSDLDQAVEEKGLFYPPDPASMTISTIGGNIAENAGGLRAFKYGVTGDFVLSLELVLPTGEVIRTGSRAIKDVAGYDLSGLIIGSEGTLTITTQATLRLLPKPEATATILAFYQSLRKAALTVSDIVASRIIPTSLEFLDKMTIQAVSDYTGLKFPAALEALLLIEVDGHPEVVKEEADKIKDVCYKNGAMEVKVTDDPLEAEKLTEARRAAFPALARIKPTTVLEDATVPRNQLADMVEGVSRIADKYDLLIATFGHAGDGNFHPTCLIDKKDYDEVMRLEKALEEIFGLAVSLGGTITGEHGIGISKARFLKKFYDPAAVSLMKRIKSSFDPQGILNPGKIFGR